MIQHEADSLDQTTQTTNTLRHRDLQTMTTMTSLNQPAEQGVTTNVTTIKAINGLSGHALKQLIKEKYPFLKPVSAKIHKSRASWKLPSWEIVVETSKVFTTNKEREEKNDEIHKWIYYSIKNSFDDDYRFEINTNIAWPMTIENVKKEEEEELKMKQKEEEKKELENKKRKRVEEENVQLELNLRPKIVKKDMGTMDEFKKLMRNEEFDEQVRALWRKELNRKADVLMSYPFKELETMQKEVSNIEQYICGVVPHVSSGDYREPFFGNMDRVFYQASCNILRTLNNDECNEKYRYSFSYDTFDYCVRLYHKVHKDPEKCSIENLRLYSLIFNI